MTSLQKYISFPFLLFSSSEDVHLIWRSRKNFNKFTWGNAKCARPVHCCSWHRRRWRFPVMYLVLSNSRWWKSCMPGFWVWGSNIFCVSLSLLPPCFLDCKSETENPTEPLRSQEHKSATGWKKLRPKLSFQKERLQSRVAWLETFMLGFAWVRSKCWLC